MKTAGILVAIFILLATGNSVLADEGCIKSFQWDKIPKDDSLKLKDILQQHGFDWVDQAQISKIDAGKIKVNTTNSILNITLKNGTVKFNGQEIIGIKVKTVNNNIIYDDSGCGSCNKNSFSWYKIPGDDDSKLKEFLSRHGYDWANSANTNIVKNSDGSILVSTDSQHSLNLRLNNGKVKINNRESNKIKFKQHENGDREIYYEGESSNFSDCGTCNKNSFSWYKIPGDDDSKLKNFLSRHGYIWADSANTNIVKNNNGNIIVSTTNPSYSLSLKLQNGKIKFNDQEHVGIKVKHHENDDREIYDEGESPDLSNCGTCNKNSFSWYKIPGDDDSKLKDFLSRHKYNWPNSAKVEKNDDKVKVQSGNKLISLELVDKEERLRIDEGTQSHYYNVKHTENDDREIYDDNETLDNSSCNNDNSIPEFPSIALPIGAVMAIMYINVRRRGN